MRTISRSGDRGRRSTPDEDLHGLGPALEFLRTLWELDHALETSSRAMKRSLGVTGPERLFVRLVGQRPGVTPKELAVLMHLDPSSITPLVKRLASRRVVRREPDLRDGRSFHLRLTPAGERLDAVRARTIEGVVRETLAAADARDVTATTRLIGSLARRLASSAEASRPRRARRGASQS